MKKIFIVIIKIQKQMTTTFQNLTSQNTAQMEVQSLKEETDRDYQNQHGLIYYFLLYAAVFCTLFLLSYLKPPKFYKNFISWFFNLSFRWRAAIWKVYNILGFFIFMMTSFLTLLKLQTDQFVEINPAIETSEKKIFRLKHKWLLESEIWLCTLIIIQLT
jgi:hypothetical protein